MKLLIAGLVVFFSIHLLPTFTGLRKNLIKKLNDLPYKALFSVISLTGLVLIVLGKRSAEIVPVWSPPYWGFQVSYFLMPLVFILLAAANLPGNFKRFTRHPMLWGITLWSLVHLLSNGDLASMVLFASFAVFSLFNMVSVNLRGVELSTTKIPVSRDIIVIIVGLVVYSAVLLIHPPQSPLLIIS